MHGCYYSWHLDTSEYAVLTLSGNLDGIHLHLSHSGLYIQFVSIRLLDVASCCDNKVLSHMHIIVSMSHLI